MIFGEKNEKVKINFGETVIEESNEETLLGITPDAKFSFKTRVQSFWRTASQKLHALSRISIFMDSEKIKLMINSFALSHFSYCLLIRRFRDRKSDKKINRIQERALRIAYRDSTSKFKEVLEKTIRYLFIRKVYSC